MQLQQTICTYYFRAIIDAFSRSADQGIYPDQIHVHRKDAALRKFLIRSFDAISDVWFLAQPLNVAKISSPSSELRRVPTGALRTRL